MVSCSYMASMQGPCRVSSCKSSNRLGSSPVATAETTRRRPYVKLIEASSAPGTMATAVETMTSMTAASPWRCMSPRQVGQALRQVIGHDGATGGVRRGLAATLRGLGGLLIHCRTAAGSG